MDVFETLHQELQSYLDSAQINTIREAFLLARKAHEGQWRHTGDPYITHPIAVALILAQMRMDPQTIMAAIMHDVIEDTPVKKNDLEEKFGKEVADLVDGVTKLTQIEFESRAQAQAENFRKMVMAMARDIRVILVKLADRLHNMRTLGHLPPDKRRRVAKETLEIFAPIANRLGIHAFCVEFEDLGFAALYPMRSRILKEAVAKSLGSRHEIIELIDKDIRNSFKKMNIPIRSLTGREKHIYSIYKKMHEKHLSFSEVMDVYGFRIIAQNPNQGKGMAVIRGIREASGELIMIQDADFEYNPEDIPALARRFLDVAAREGLPSKALDQHALEGLRRHHWPGNVRELENLMRRLAVLERGDVITASAVQAGLGARAMPPTAAVAATLSDAAASHIAVYFQSFGGMLPPDGVYDRLLAEVERPLITACLDATGGNQMKAAKLLGMNRNTLRRKLNDLGLDPLSARPR